MIHFTQEQKYILLIAPVGRGRNKRLPAGCNEGKAFPLLIVLICLYLEKLADEKLTGKDGKTILNTIHTKVDGFNSSQVGSIVNLNSLVGGLATSALSYGLTGEATFNVLNISNFGAGASCGLLEVSVGNNGVKTRLGTGGTDVSVGTLLSAISGIKNLGMNEKIKKAAQENNMAQSATALRMLYGFGDDKGLELLDDVLNKKVSLAAGSGPENAQTILENGKRTVYLNGYSNDMTREEQLKLGITLGHEAYRDGVKGSIEKQMAETFSAVAGHTAMIKRVQNDSLYSSVMTGIIESDMNLKNDVTRFDYALKNNDWSSFGEYVLGNYDYSADYWKFTKDGNIVWDGSKNLYDEDGKLMHEYKGDGGSTAALAEGLGISELEAREMLRTADYRWDNTKHTFIDEKGNDVKNIISQAAITNESVKNRYDFQHNYADKVFDNFGGSMQNALQAYVAKQLEPYEETWDTPVSTEQLAASMKIASEYYEFAQKYDESMAKYGNVGSNNITQEIYDNIYNQTGWQRNDNILYTYINNGTVNPVGGEFDITTYAFYGPGLESYGIKEGDRHSTSINGTAADLGTYKKNLPVVSVFNSSFLINNSYGYTSGGGNFISLYTNNLKNDYKHLLGSSNAYSTMHTLNSYGHNVGIWSFPVPSNYQIGNVGNSGTKTSGVHLHFQNTRWR